jgi:hypothetical protein
VAAVEELQELMILLVAHVASPYDLGRINVRIVIHPIAIYVVVGTISHDHKMLAGNPAQLRDYFGSLKVATWPRWFEWSVNRNCGNPQNNHRQ